MTEHISSSKRIRLDSDTNNSRSDYQSSQQVRLQKKLTDKIFYQKDYLSCICQYLTIKEIFGIISLLSSYHCNDYLNNKLQLNMIKMCLFHDFGDILNAFKIKLDNANENENICIKIGRFYNDWNYLMLCAKNAGFKIDESHPYCIDFTALMKLEKNECVQHWITKVWYSLFTFAIIQLTIAM